MPTLPMRWIIGDIHGMLRPLEVLLDAVRLADAHARFYFAGDYVNRGPDSKRVIDLLLRLPDARFIRGNHDDILDQILSGAGYAPNASEGSPIAAFQWFMQWGLDKTLLSYGADLMELDRIMQHPTAERLMHLMRCVPESHRGFIHDLPASIEDDDLFVLHGKWDVDVRSESPGLAERIEGSPLLRRSALWERYELDEVRSKKAWRRVGYFGHTPVDYYRTVTRDGELRPILGPKIVLVDTACAISPDGRLTAFCHEKSGFIQVTRTGKLVEKDEG